MQISDLNIEELSERLHAGLKEFRDLVDGLGANALKRILISVMEFPVESTQKLVGERERIVANVGIDLKSIMTHMAIAYLVNRQNEEPQNAEETKPVKKTRKTVKKEK